MAICNDAWTLGDLCSIWWHSHTLSCARMIQNISICDFVSFSSIPSSLPLYCQNKSDDVNVFDNYYKNTYSQALPPCKMSTTTFSQSLFRCSSLNASLPVVNLKRWCILQSIVVTLLCCYPSFLLEPQCDLVTLLRLNNQHGCTTGGRGNVCACGSVLCMHFNACLFSYNACVFSMFAMWSKGNYDCVSVFVCTEVPPTPSHHLPLWELGCMHWNMILA